MIKTFSCLSEFLLLDSLGFGTKPLFTLPGAKKNKISGTTAMKEEVKEQIPHIQASAIRLPDFWDSNLEACLAFAKSPFRRAGIKSELAKFDAVVEKLPLSLITKLTFLIAKPPQEEPYAKLCAELIKLASLSDREKYQTLMQSLEIGDSKPSDLSQRMKQLLSDENPDTFFFRQMFLQKLPPVIQQIIAVISSPDAPWISW